MKSLKITQIKSTIKKPRDQKDTIRSLGLGKINRSRVVEATPQYLGMIAKVSHLLKVEEV